VKNEEDVCRASFDYQFVMTHACLFLLILRLDKGQGKGNSLYSSTATRGPWKQANKKLKLKQKQRQ
jgi:hypothetical protein